MPRDRYLGPLLGALLLLGATGACGGADNATEGLTTAEFVAAANPICQGFAAGLQEQMAAESPTWSLGPPYRAASTAMAALGVTAASSPEAFELQASMNEAADSIEALDAAIVEALTGKEEPGGMYSTEDGKVWAFSPGSSWLFAQELDVPPELALAAWSAQSRVREASIALGLSDCAFGGDDSAGGS